MPGTESMLLRPCKRRRLERGKMSEDGLVSVETNACTGWLDRAPAPLASNGAIPRLTP